MIRRRALLLLTLPIAAAVPAASAVAQYYPAPPPQGYYRNAPPPGAYDDDRGPPPGFWADDDDDRPVRRQRRWVPPGRYRDDEADALPPPGFVPPPGARPPAYGHQLDQRGPVQGAPPAAAAGAPPPAAESDPDAVRPPGAIGAASARPAATPPAPSASAIAALPPEDQPEQGQPKELPPNLRRQLVDYPTKQPSGTIVIDTPNTYLYLVLGNGKAMRYGIGVGREGFTWSGTERISNMREWPDWYPPAEMIERQPYLPRMMAGGPGNPLGARALYLGNTLYRIHGTNQPSTIGKTVSSGCIRLLNEDIEDLFSRVQVGTRVVVLPGKAPETVANTGAAVPHGEQANSPPAPRNAPATSGAPAPRNGTAVSSSPLPPVR